MMRRHLPAPANQQVINPDSRRDCGRCCARTAAEAESTTLIMRLSRGMSSKHPGNGSRSVSAQHPSLRTAPDQGTPSPLLS